MKIDLFMLIIRIMSIQTATIQLEQQFQKL